MSDKVRINDGDHLIMGHTVDGEDGLRHGVVARPDGSMENVVLQSGSGSGSTTWERCEGAAIANVLHQKRGRGKSQVVASQ